VGRRLVRLVWPLVILVLACGVFFLGLFPTRTYLDQRTSIAAAETELDELTVENDELQRQVAILESDEEIERIAREQYGLAKPGEELYQILPPPEDPVQVPQVWPFNRLDQQLGN
jgi:cell division protein FtsB